MRTQALHVASLATDARSASYAGELVWAAVLVAFTLVGAMLLWLRSRRTAPGNLFVGADNRISTSKTIAVAWTVVVSWMLVSEAFIAAFPHPNTFSGLLHSASDLYFVFLGGPFAAAAFAKASVQSKIAQGTLTKNPGTPAASDVISDDNGNTDLYDFQYVLFNLLALLIVAISFGAHPGNGLPDVPAFLAILTGGSALTYTVNKAIAADGPQITSVDPANARIGDIITVVGTQLFSTTAGGALPAVTIGGISATGVAIPPGSTDTLTATVADAPAGIPLTGTKDVAVSPPLASPITARNAITIVADKPKITKIQPQPIKPGSLITVAGILLLTPGTAAGAAAVNTPSIGGLTPTLTVSGNAWAISVEGEYSDSQLTLRVGAPPAGIPGTGTANLTLTRGALRPSGTVNYQV